MWSKQGGVYPNQWEGCEGLCTVNAPGIGFAFDCQEPMVESINYGTFLENALERGINDSTAMLFSIRFNTVYVSESEATAESKSSYLEMEVTHTRAKQSGSSLSCPGSRFTQSCKLIPALISYPVQIQNNSGGFLVSVGAHGPIKGSIEDVGLGKYSRSLRQQIG